MKITKKLKRLAALCMALVLLVGNVPVRARAAQQTDELRATVDAQVKAFAQSIYYADADEDAAWALATHGITNRKALNVENDHPLTATLANSAMMKEHLTETLTVLIRHMDEPGFETAYIRGNLIWSSEKYVRAARLITDNIHNGGFITLASTGFAGKKNNFDFALEWMASNVVVEFNVNRIETTANTVTYGVEVLVWDDFDFSTGNSSIPKELASIIGSFLFRSFHWTSTMTFNLTVPNLCNHRPDNYHFTYDSQERQLYADNTGGYVANGVERYSFENSGGTQYYYEVDRTIQLSSDQPWVMEYAIQRPRYFRMTNAASGYNRQPTLDHVARSLYMIYAVEYNEEGKSERVRYYGRIFSDYFQYSHLQRYTFRLENEVYDDGSNMIFLSVYNDTKGEVAMDRLPLNNYYTSEDGKYILVSENDPYISGMDFAINFIGNDSTPFSADYYDLKVWENGVDAQLDDYMVETVIQPTCTEKGYTAHTCPECGYSYRDNYVNAKGHSFGDWTATRRPDCVTAGSEKHTCTRCGLSESRTLPATGHAYNAVITRPTCTAEGYTTHTCACGDSYVDGYTDVLPHSFTNYVSNGDATCTADGTKTAVCDDCPAMDTMVDEGSMLAHPYTSIVTEATCTEQGYTTYTCSCGDSYVDNFTDVLPHSFTNYVSNGDAACTADGTKTAVCDNCPAMDTMVDEGSMLAHPYTSVVTEATCTERGYTTYTCSCGDSYTDSFVEAAGHAYVKGVCTTCGDETTYVEAPTVSVANVASTGKIKISWNKVDGAVKYQLYRAESRNGAYKLLTTTKGTSITNTSSTAGKTYYYYVVAVAEDGTTSEPSAIKSRTCDLAQPVIKVSNNASSGKVKLTWEKINGAAGYKVYRAVSRDGTYKLMKTATGTTYTDTSAKAGQTYYYKVKAIGENSAADSAFSAVKSRTCDLSQPEVSITRSSGKPKVSWDKVSGAVSFKVYRSTSQNGTYSLIKTTTSRAYTDVKAAKNKTCYYKVVAVCNPTAGNSAYSRVVSIKATK